MSASFYKDVVVRPAKDLKEARDLWWPLMTTLGWVNLSMFLCHRKRKNLTVNNVQNRSYHDLESYISASQSRGLLVAVPDGYDEPVGHCQSTIYDNATGWVTLFGIKVVFRTLDFLLIDCSGTTYQPRKKLWKSTV